MISYAILLIIGAAAAVLAWLAIRQQERRYPRQLFLFRRSYPLFILFFTVLAVLVLAAIKEPSARKIYQNLGFGSVALLLLVLALPIFLANLRLEGRVRKMLARRALIMLVAAGLPGVLYWALAGRVDEDALAIVLFVGAIVAICLLTWDLYKHRTGGD